jgi:hypothetical protein
MDLDAIGAHILLICAAAASPEGYRIHADERAIRVRLRNPSDEDWARIKSQIFGTAWKLSQNGEWWEQHGLRRIIEKQREFSAKQRERVSHRWNGDEPFGNTGSIPDEYRTDTESIPSSSFSSSDSTSSFKMKVPRHSPSTVWKKKKTSATNASAGTDSRHSVVREFVVQQYESRFQTPCPWDGSEATSLNRFLKANSKLTVQAIETLVQNYFSSEGITSARPTEWISKLNRYASGPTDRFGKSLSEDTNAPRISRAQQTTLNNLRACEEAKRFIDTALDS